MNVVLQDTESESEKKAREREIERKIMNKNAKDEMRERNEYRTLMGV